MSGLAFMRPRIVVSVLLALLVGGIGVAAAPVQQTPTVQPTKPILLTDPVPDPKQEGVRWFSATGHTLRGEFLDYWTRYGGLEQFGYPLTEEFFEEVGPENKQYRVQYFERNRFEHHPENAATPYEVLLGTLGREFRQQDPPAQPLPAPAVYFRETGHNLSGVFKGYWDTHGGLFVHGFPITEEIEERSSTDGKVYRVQYFERSRFEYHPENRETKYEVLLGLLGKQLSEKRGYPRGAYPHFGYAHNLSWIAGEVVLYNPFFNCHAVSCGCALMRYDEFHNVQIQSVRSENPNRPVHLGELRSDGEGKHFIFFGRKARPGEYYRQCVQFDTPGYFVESVQSNWIK